MVTMKTLKDQKVRRSWMMEIDADDNDEDVKDDI